MSVPIYMIDFEGSTSSGILEYGVVEILGGQIYRTWTRLCRPLGRIAQRDRLTHGLSDNVLSGCSPIEEDWAFFSGLRERGVLAAHHAVVEAALIKSVWPCPRLAPDYTQPEAAMAASVAQWGPWVDSLALYRRIYPHLTGYGLDALVRQFGLEDSLTAIASEHCPANRRGYHRALYDALAAALLLQALIHLPDYQQATLPDWIHWSAASTDSQDNAQLHLGL